MIRPHDSPSRPSHGKSSEGGGTRRGGIDIGWVSNRHITVTKHAEVKVKMQRLLFDLAPSDLNAGLSAGKVGLLGVDKV